MSKAELLLLSSIINEQDHVTPSKYNISAEHWHGFPAEWAWLDAYISKHGKTPSKHAFRHHFPQTRLVKVADTAHYCEEVLRAHAKFEVLRACEEAMAEVSSGDPLEALRQMQQSSIKAGMSVSLTGKHSDVLEDYEDIYAEAKRRVEAAQSGNLPGFPTGFHTLDGRTGGPQPGHLWVVGARLGEGKSWAMMRMACSALREGMRVQFSSLEMSRSQVALRAHTFLSSMVGEQTFRNMDLMLGKNYSLREYKKFVRELKGNLNGGSLYVSDMSRGRVSPASIAALIEQNRPDVVFVDYITLMQREADGWEGVAQLSGELKTLAERYAIPIVVAAQMNRQAAFGNEPADPDKLAEGDTIGRDADAVVTMKQQSPHVMKMKLAKYRHGPDGYTWWCTFDVNNGSFEECTYDEAMLAKDADEEEADDVMG